MLNRLSSWRGGCFVLIFAVLVDVLSRDRNVRFFFSEVTKRWSPQCFEFA